MNDIQLRKTARIPIALPIIYKTETSPEIPVKCLDINEGGICIPVSSEHQTDEEISLSIAIPNRGSINCKGQVSWIKSDRIGLRFTEIIDENRRKLVEFLTSLGRMQQLETIRNTEATLRNLKSSIEELEKSEEELRQLIELAGGKVTEKIHALASKLGGNIVIQQAIEKVREKLTGQLSNTKKELQNLPQIDQSDLKELSVCRYSRSPHFGSFCGIKYADFSEGKEWDERKCERKYSVNCV